MKILTLKAEITPLRLSHNKDIYARDIKGVFPSMISGEWCQLEDAEKKKYFLAFFNLQAQDLPIGRVVCEIPKKFSTDADEKKIAEDIIKKHLNRAYYRREKLVLYKEGFRLCHGTGDSLPGLVVDVYVDAFLIQITSAGIDRFRLHILEYLQQLFPNKQGYFLDNEMLRSKELLPQYPNKLITTSLFVKENGLQYELYPSMLQKVGYYYDHRQNRAKLESSLRNMSHIFKNGLDLFSYCGPWGLHLLRSNVEKVTFVDQGDMQSIIFRNLELNHFSGRGTFIRKDVFSFLDEVKNSPEKFDIVVSDPPAFKKNDKNKSAALSGYEKLHAKIFPIMAEESLLAVCSCTSNISLEELDHTVALTAVKNMKRVRLLDIGVQGYDHPFSSLGDKNYYLKYLLYAVESL